MGIPCSTLIDTDPGIDDALALLYAWGSPDLVWPAITTVAGNVHVGDATVNLFRLLAPPAADTDARRRPGRRRSRSVARW